MGFTLRTPEYPNGRKQKAIVIANDITYKIGSFEPFKDSFFYQVTQFARTYLQTPVLVLDSQRKLFHSSLLLGSMSRIQRRVSTITICHREIIWNCKMAKGIWHRPDGWKQCGREWRHKVTDVISRVHGVECLKGSGLIAGETSRAYDDIFTITLVTARSVGIGAYLVRLGEWAVQVEGQPIILTRALLLEIGMSCGFIVRAAFLFNWGRSLLL